MRHSGSAGGLNWLDGVGALLAAQVRHDDRPPSADGRSRVESGVREALEAGCRWLIAPYGCMADDTGRVAADFLRGLDGEHRPALVATVAPVVDLSSPQAASARVVHPPVIESQCREALSRLGVSRLDGLLLRLPDEVGTDVRDSWGEAVRLRNLGLVASIGLVGPRPGVVSSCLAAGAPDIALVPFEPRLPQRFWHAVRICGAARIRVMATCAARTRDEPPEWRAALSLVGHRHGVSSATVVSAWLLARPDVSGVCALIGSAGGPRAWAAGSALRLTHHDMAQLGTAAGGGDQDVCHSRAVPRDDSYAAALPERSRLPDADDASSTTPT